MHNRNLKFLCNILKIEDFYLFFVYNKIEKIPFDGGGDGMIGLDAIKDDLVLKGNAPETANKEGNLMKKAEGDIASKVHLTLLGDSLYLEYQGQSGIGQVDKQRNIVKIPLNNIKEIKVTSEGHEETMEIKTDKKDFLFIRNHL